MSPSERILVVEDNETTARTLRLFLQARGYEVVCAADGGSGLQRFRREPFDLVLLDLMLPGMDGLAVCREIRSSSEVPVVMLTARTAEASVVEGLEAGADDYVGKPYGSRELLARVRRCLERARPAGKADDVLRVGNLEVDPRERSVSLEGEPIRLTRTEFDLLQVLARSPGRVFTRGQLIERAFGDDYSGYDRTVDTHVWSLRRKLGEPRGNPRYLRSEVGVGYRLEDPDGA